MRRIITGKIISIHAPARGATACITSLIPFLKISIHAPARGATSYEMVWEYFNFISIHAPARGATFEISRKNKAIFISIHAPARGATNTTQAPVCIIWDFNPRSREGSDDPLRNQQNLHNQFQSTLPRGERRAVILTYPTI